MLAGYQEFAVKLIQSLEDAIQVDLDGAEEREVGRHRAPACPRTAALEAVLN